MKCPYCGEELREGAKYCTNCGATVSGVGYDHRDADRPERAVNTVVVTGNEVPYQNRPLSAWAYFGYEILFAIPLIGFICLLIFSFSDKNINRRNFARSYFCALLIAVIIIVVSVVIAAATGTLDSLLESIESM